MKSPTRIRIWQAFAQAARCTRSAFAMMQKCYHCFQVGQRRVANVLHRTSCSHFPTLRSGLPLAGPTLPRGRANAGFADHSNNCFEIPVIAVKSDAITTNQRGSSKCGNPLSSSPSFRPRWPVACRTLHRAAWSARLPVQLSPTHSMKTSSRVPRLADLPAQPLVASKLACRPAPRATDPLADRAAFGRTGIQSRTIRADRPGGPLLFAEGKADV